MMWSVSVSSVPILVFLAVETSSATIVSAFQPCLRHPNSHKCSLGLPNTSNSYLRPPKNGLIPNSQSRGGSIQTEASLLASASTSTSSMDKNDKKDDSVTAPTLPNWDPTNWTAKRLHNRPLFRVAAIVAALSIALSSLKQAGSPAGWTASAVTAPLTSFLSKKAAATIHMLSFGTWIGSVVFTTFVGGITMYKNLPRKTFGRLQSKLFPKFFNLCFVTIVLQILTINALPTTLIQKATVALGTSLSMTLLNLFYLEPKATSVMFQRYELEDQPNGSGTESPEYKQLASSFGKLHGMSSLANLIALCGGVAHALYLASAVVG